MVLLIGLAVGVDYSMFYLKREREERAAGRSEQAALEAAAATSGRSVLDLRPDRDGGDGRHVPDRRRDLRVARPRDDPRRRDRGARLADRAARRCSRGSATRSTGCASRSSAGSAATTARAGSGARSSTASCAGPLCRPSSPAGCCWRSPLPALQLRMAHAGPRHVPAVARRRQDVQPHAAGVPRHGAAGERRRQGAERERTGGAARRSAGSSSRRSRAAACTSRSRSTSTGTRTVANITVPIDGNGTDAASNAVARGSCASEIVPETVGAAPERRGRRHRAHGRSGRTRPTS